MKINELELNKKYTNEDGAIFNFDYYGEFYFWDKDEEEWAYATRYYSTKELLNFEYKEYLPQIEYTEEEKEVAKLCLGLGLESLVVEGGCEYYCIDTKEIKFEGSFWNYNEEESHYWVDVAGLPKLANSTLLEKVTQDQPIFFEDVIK